VVGTESNGYSKSSVSVCPARHHIVESVVASVIGDGITLATDADHGDARTGYGVTPVFL